MVGHPFIKLHSEFSYAEARACSPRLNQRSLILCPVYHPLSIVVFGHCNTMFRLTLNVFPRYGRSHAGHAAPGRNAWTTANERYVCPRVCYCGFRIRWLWC